MYISYRPSESNEGQRTIRFIKGNRSITVQNDTISKVDYLERIRIGGSIMYEALLSFPFHTIYERHFF